MHDATDEARAAEELQLRERQLRSILATVPEATIITDSAGTIVSLSGVAQSLFGYAETDIVGCDASMQIGRASWGKRVSVRVDLGGRRIITKKTNEHRGATDKNSPELRER